MGSFQLENLSPFGRLAVKLDADFAELTRLSAQIQKVDIDSDSGLTHAGKLLSQFAELGQSISDGIQNFSTILQEAGQRSEAAAKSVGERAEQIRQRKEHQGQVRQKLNQVEQDVTMVNASLAGFRREGKTGFSDEEKSQIRTQLERINVDLKKFLANAQAVKDEASQANFKSIEHDAQNLLEALRSSSRKVDKAISGS